MINIPQIAIALIKKYEGYSSDVYICPAGYKTIGYGHLIKKGEFFVDPLSQQEADELLEKDLHYYSVVIFNLITVRLNEMQFSALLSFSFNLGGGALERSILRQKLNREEYLSAADEFPRWVYAGGVKLPGLIKRRQEEQSIFLL